MKPSEITPDEVIKYARMDDMDADLSPEALLAAAKAFVKSYTGLTDEELDKHEEISIRFWRSARTCMITDNQRWKMIR